MDHCKVISFQSTGYNEADLDYAKEKGIAVCSILDYCTQETAESAMALMLNLQRGIRQYDRSVQQDHVWDYQVVPHLKRIAGQVMGIAGLGRIGQSVARKAQAFDMEVIAYDPFLPPAIAENLGVKLVDFDTLLAESDVLSLHMNLTEENYHMFNKEAFMKCKKHPIIVNEGRGPLICDEDLVWALDNATSAAPRSTWSRARIRIWAPARSSAATTCCSPRTAATTPTRPTISSQSCPWTTPCTTSTASTTRSSPSATASTPEHPPACFRWAANFHFLFFYPSFCSVFAISTDISSLLPAVQWIPNIRVRVRSPARTRA